MDLFKLIGTIAINNAEAKKALKEAGEEGEKTEGKLSKTFGAIGKGAAVAGKAIATGLVAGATACVGLATAAINAYGDYEQLIGGVETLFGTRGAESVEEYAKMVGKSVKDVEAEFGMLQQAQSDVMENASNAYKTAGLSMNEYMETANGLAAALNQSSASQLESAALADQAIIDMADNAAKMGTSMESIQTAYAGFAKQNYTMLDNLKLGYGGTKEEMQRLLDDAGKIAGTKFDLSSFADVTEAIHVMQVEMGIAGTTAAEASDTIQGSWGMLKGAWSNLMVGLSDPEADLGKLIDNVFSSVNTFAGNLVPRISQVLSGIATSFKTLVPMITAEIPGLLNQVLPPLIEGAVALVDGLVAALPGVLSALMDVLPSLIDGIMQLVDALVGALPGILQTLFAALPTLLPQLIDAVVSMIMMLVEMLPQIIQPIIDNLPTIIIAIVEALVNNLPVLIQGLIQLIMGIVTAIPQIIQSLVEALPTIIALLTESLLMNLPTIIFGLIQVVIGIVAALPQIFMSLIQAVPLVLAGVWDGIMNVFGNIDTFFKNIWDGVTGVFKTAWNGIKAVVSSFVNGIANVIKTVWNSIKNTISNVLNGIKAVVSNVWNAIKTVIGTVVNGIKTVISDVWNGIKNTISSALNGIKTVVSTVWNGIKTAISSVVNGIKTFVSTGFNDVKNKVINAFKSLPAKIKSIGKDLISGLWNGIGDKFSWLTGKIKGFAKNVTDKLKGFFGIKSPSRVFRDEIGKQLADGVAVGITENTETAENAAEKMAKNVLDAAQKRLDDYTTYNEMTLADEVAFWDSVRTQVSEGTDARLEADKKYLEAKKSLNEQMLSAEKDLQDSLDEINQNIADRTKETASSFNLFDPAESGEKISAKKLKENLKTQVFALEDYDANLRQLGAKLGINSALYKEIEAMGIGALEEMMALNSMSESDLLRYVDLYDKRNVLASKISNNVLADEIAVGKRQAYQKYSDTIAGYGVLVENPSAFNYGSNGAGASSDTMTNDVQSAVASQNAEVVGMLSRLLAAILDMDSNMGNSMREALENLSLKIGEREFARLVKAVN